MTRESGCGFEYVDSPVYPPSPHGDELRAARTKGQRHVTLGDAARHLRIGTTDMSGLERGSRTFATESEWASALAMIKELASRQS